MLDKRITPFRADLAAEHLKGEVDAPRYAQGTLRSVWVGRIPLRVRPSDDAAQDSELLFGDTFTVYDRTKGWCWGQAGSDDSGGRAGGGQAGGRLWRGAPGRALSPSPTWPTLEPRVACGLEGIALGDVGRLPRHLL